MERQQPSDGNRELMGRSFTTNGVRGGRGTGDGHGTGENDE